MAKTLPVGLIGTAFMGKAHSNAYRQVDKFFPVERAPQLLKICGRRPAATKQAAKTYGWEESTTNWKELVSDKRIELVDVSTPNNSHAEMSIAAAQAKKHVFCEKPLAMNAAEARAMLEAAEKAGVVHAVAFNYRCVPAVALAKRMIEEGKIGKIYHWRACYLQDWILDPKFPLVWRLRKEVAGAGVHGDLNAHLIDLAHYLVGPITEVCGMMTTFIKQRPLEDTGGLDTGLKRKAGQKMGEVTVDDAALFLARFKNGALGSFEATRFAGGNKNRNTFEINGSKGSLRFDFEAMNELWYYDAKHKPSEAGFRRILATESDIPYAGHWWPPGHGLGYEHGFIHLVYELCNAIDKGTPVVASFRDGLACQEVLDAVELSANENRWVKLEEVR